VPGDDRALVTVGSATVVLGAVALIAGSFMRWFPLAGIDVSGMSRLGGQRDGPVFISFGIVLGGLVITVLAARTVVAVAIIAVVVAVLALLAAIADLRGI
jgi:hypothetical protein